MVSPKGDHVAERGMAGGMVIPKGDHVAERGMNGTGLSLKGRNTFLPPLQGLGMGACVVRCPRALPWAIGLAPRWG